MVCGCCFLEVDGYALWYVDVVAWKLMVMRCGMWMLSPGSSWFCAVVCECCRLEVHGYALWYVDVVAWKLMVMHCGMWMLSPGS